ncbi:ribulose-phosphate 3-epimerase [Zhaonella formicivorans]|uniref:ribulose-phosphate 3-epimerase n=1 Tax=Zhaonella formicivorans TaxID=2528593 RepID=UPI0010EC38C8|nr:ribulose-phosphate 3-epimerase [Zhaonella formicivorans]
MIRLAPSLLAADFSSLGTEVSKAEQAGVELLHLDIMDGHFVPNITFGPDLVKVLRSKSKLLFDVHLMIAEPDRYIPAFARAGADFISVHVETCLHLHRTLQNIREQGVKAAVALNPATPLSTIEYVLSEVEMVLLMTVNPGFGGQQFIKAVLPKIAELRKIIDSKGLSVDIEVDGGINAETAPLAVQAGANILVAGSAIFGQPDVSLAAKTLRDSIAGI